MKKILLPALLVLGMSGFRANAQLPFPTISYVDINNIKASVLVHGDMWWDPATQVSQCFFPATTTKNIGFAAALWMSGYDAGSQLHIASQMYRQNGNDYWPGPLNASDTLDYTTSTNWAKIWKVNRTTIDSFRALTTHTVANTAASILQWPGTGNTYAVGNAGAALTVTAAMAPFVDLNANGIYEPLMGEYPDFHGDQALWWVVSDNGPTHNESNGLPLGVEVHTLAYAYKRGTLIDNVIYYEYTITNKSPNSYSNFRIGQFADMDLGNFRDDFVGFDSVHRMGITYNGDPFDSTYGVNIPMAGVTMVVLPGDTGTTYVPAGSFMYFNNDSLSDIGNPVGDTQKNHYLRSMTRSGMHISDDYVGAGTPTIGYGSGPLTNYTFTGDPSNLAQWSECSSGNFPGDRRFVIASNDFTMTPGATKKVVMALVSTNLDTNNACGDATISFTSIKTVADTAWGVFLHPLPGVGVAAVTDLSAEVTIYPNPAYDMVNISLPEHNSPCVITLINEVGQVIATQTSTSKTAEINLNMLAPGLYIVKVELNGSTVYKKIQKA